MAGEHTQVTPSDLVVHAATVETIADQVTTAQQAGAATRMGAGAYGQLCTIVPQLLAELQEHVVDGIATAAGSLRDTGSRLRTAADGYRTTDAHVASVHDRIRAGL